MTKNLVVIEHLMTLRSYSQYQIIAKNISQMSTSITRYLLKNIKTVKLSPYIKQYSLENVYKKYFPLGNAKSPDVFKKELRKLYIGNKNSIDISELLTNATTILEDTKIFMFVGRMVEEKGLTTLIDLIKEDNSGSLFIIASKGDDTNSYHQDITQLIKEDKNIIFLDNNEKQNQLKLFFMAISDVALVPSHAETFGLSAAEASLMGMYVLYSKVGGLPESVSKYSGPVEGYEVRQWQNAINEVVNETLDVNEIV